MTADERSARIQELRREIAALTRAAPMYDADASLKGPRWEGYEAERSMRTAAEARIRTMKQELTALVAAQT